jgi:hypothetical protein
MKQHLGVLLLCVSWLAHAAPRPNIDFFLAADPGCYDRAAKRYPNQ